MLLTQLASTSWIQQRCEFTAGAASNELLYACIICRRQRAERCSTSPRPYMLYRYPVPPKKELQGRTDQYIGSWLAGRKRQDVILASKVGHAAMIAMCAVSNMLTYLIVRPHSHSLSQNTWLYLVRELSASWCVNS